MVSSGRFGARLFLAVALLGASSSGWTQQGDLEGEDSLNWPKEIEGAGSKIVIYQPQLESLQGNQLTARAAVSVTRPGADTPVFGGLWFEARLLTDRDRRTATPVDVKVTEVRFPEAQAGDVDALRKTLGLEVPRWRLTLSMDHLLSELKVLQEQKIAVEGLKNDPPRIVYRSHPTVLLTIEGEPSWRDLPGTPYQRIANSAFFVLKETTTGTCTLHIPPFWWIAPSASGPWQELAAPSAAAADAWRNEPKPDLPAPDPGQEAPERPEVFVADQPTELIWTQGPPQYAPISGTGLLYVKNTSSDVFMEIQSQVYYVLLSGRWYRKPAGKGKGTWSYLPPEQLPPDFGRIPVGSPKQHILASVAGTAQAREAVLDAEIPQTAAVAPGEAPDLAVSYDGAPRFEAAEGCAVQYAVNTPYSVFLVGGRYFCCQDGIWYESAIADRGWIVCVRVAPEIYLIPPSCPHYFCTYCHVFGSSPEAVYVGFYPGYRGCYVGGHTVVFGTGWHYPIWHGSLWFPRPVTWGVGVRYNHYSGSWKIALGAGGPSAWMGLAVHPDWKGHSAPVGVGGWWGGVGYAHTQVDVHHNLSFVAHASRGAELNLYARRPEKLAPVHSRAAERVKAPEPGKRAPNDVFTDRQGNAYRRPAEGEWEQHTPQGWAKPALKPPPESHHDLPRMEQHHQELEQHSQARNEGIQRAQNYQKNTPPPKPPPPPPKPPPPPPPRKK
jgi:hypothetical protein